MNENNLHSGDRTGGQGEGDHTDHLRLASDALRRALHMVQQNRSHQQASSEGEAMEQDDLTQETAPPEQKFTAEEEGEIVRPPRGQGIFGCNKAISRRGEAC